MVSDPMQRRRRDDRIDQLAQLEVEDGSLAPEFGTIAVSGSRNATISADASIADTPALWDDGQQSLGNRPVPQPTSRHFSRRGSSLSRSATSKASRLPAVD